MTRTRDAAIITTMCDESSETPEQETGETDGQRRFDVHVWFESYLAQLRDDEVVEELVGVPLS